MSDSHKAPLEGIGGWLVLPLLLLIISPIRAAIVLYRELLPIFTNGVWNALTTPGTHFYHPLWFPLLVGKTLGNLAVALLALVTLCFYIRRSRLTPKLVIAFLIFSLLFFSTDFYLAGQIPMLARQGNLDTMADVARSFIGAAIWIPYFLMSKRVKATFIR
jgi:Protein of unknown function (DUF2569)